MGALGRNAWFALLTFALAIVAGWTAFGYAADSSWFPRVLAVFLGVMAVLLLLRSLREEAQEQLVFGRELRSAALIFGAGILYALMISVLSFEIANFLFLAGAMFALGQRNPWVIVGVSLASMFLVKLLFFIMLDVPRPQVVLY
ncbi:MAG: tripartite tricarboxylate transporter TctB family protein [Woeseiaceae bacterium]|nr:tripartite tricarboxylate transporter TctB family protein [Woeseiaceae bacterium]